MATPIVLEASRVADGGVHVVEAGALRIALFGSVESFYAIDEICPHQGGSLAKGAFDGRIVICPLHRFHVDVTTGRSPNTPFLRVQTFPAERDGALLRIQT